MRNSWLMWVFIVGVVVTVLVVFNYEGTQDSTSLSEIFPDEEAYPVDVEYEFVDADEIIKEEAAAQEEVAPIHEKISQTTTAAIKKVQEIVKVPKAKPRRIITAKLPAGKIPFTIQVASFKEKPMAEKALTRILNKGYDAFIVGRDLGAKGTWYRIYIGRFNSKGEAQGQLTRVKDDYASSFIISPK